MLSEKFETVRTTEFEENRYLKVPALLSQQTASVLARYSKLSSFFSPSIGNAKTQMPGVHSVYADHMSEGLLEELWPELERICGQELWPCFSFYRLYRPGDELSSHIDRLSCEISATICLGYSYESSKVSWPIAFKDKHGRTHSYQQSPGDALIYSGCELEHWREKFIAPADCWHAQVFLHFIRRSNPLADVLKYDGRPMLGFPPEMKDPKKVKIMEDAFREYKKEFYKETK